MTKLSPVLHPSRSETFSHPHGVFHFGKVPLCYFDEGDGLPIVFVHGLGGNFTHFEYLTRPLHAAGYRVIGLDLPGFGLSGKPRRDYSIVFLAGAVEALMDHLHVPSAVLCGHSLGGLVVADVALRFPERALGLVLISSAGLSKFSLPTRLAVQTLVRPEWVRPMLEKNASRMLNFVVKAKNQRTARFAEQCLTRPDQRFCRDLAVVLHALRRDLMARHLLGDVHRLTMPTLVIWGRSDRLLPLHPVPRFVQALPQGALEVIDGCGHMPIIEDPEAVLRPLHRFLTALLHQQPLGRQAHLARRQVRTH